MFFRISGNMELDSPSLHVLPLKLETKCFQTASCAQAPPPPRDDARVLQPDKPRCVPEAAWHVSGFRQSLYG